MLRFIFLLALNLPATSLCANLVFHFDPHHDKTHFVTQHDLPEGIAELPEAYGFVNGRLEEINFMGSTRRGHRITVRIGGIYYLAEQVRFDSTEPIVFRAKNIGGLTITRNDDAPHVLTSKRSFIRTMTRLFACDTQNPAYFVPAASHHNLRVNGFCPSKDLRLYDDFTHSREEQFEGNSEYGDVKYEQFVISYSDRLFKVLHISHTATSTIFFDLMKAVVEEDGEQQVKIYAGTKRPFATINLGPDFEINQDIPQIVITLSPDN